MIGDADAWKEERLRRFGLALDYHRVVDQLAGLDARTWLERSSAATAGHDTSTAYALIHRDVAPVTPERLRELQGQRAFASVRRLVGARCEANLVWGYDCPMHTPSHELELDHSWPFALGGQSVPSNGIWLCKLHNRAKSHDIHNYDWPELWPSWLLVMMSLIRADCERQLRLIG